MTNKQAFDIAVAMHQDQTEKFKEAGLVAGNELVAPILQRHLDRRARPENIYASFLRELYDLEAEGDITSIDVIFWKNYAVQELISRMK